jgi:hypothetical protein
MNVEPQVPPPPVPPSTGASPAHPSLQLQYATPKPAGRWQTGPDAPVLRVIRQIVFAIGLALLLFGLTSALARVYERDAPYYAAWGAGFIGLATPLWRVRRDEE